MKNLKQYYKGLEIVDIITYNQHETFTVEIDVDVILQSGDVRTLEMTNPLHSKKFDKGWVARSINLKTRFDNGNEFIEDILSSLYIFDDKDAQEFLTNEGYIIEKEVESKDYTLLDILQSQTNGFSKDSAQRKNILKAMDIAFTLGEAYAKYQDITK